MNKLDLQTAQAQWLEHRRLNVSPNTWNWYRRMTNSFVNYIGEKRPLVSVTSSELVAWRIYLMQKRVEVGDYRQKQIGQRILSPSTINGHLRAFRQLWGWLQAQGYAVAPIPCQFKDIKKQRERLKAICITDLEKLIEAAKPYPLTHALIRWLASTGCRLDEVVNLRLTDLSFRQAGTWYTFADVKHQYQHVALFNFREWDCQAVVMGKGEKVRTVVAGTNTTDVLLKYLLRHRGEYEFNRVWIGRYHQPLGESGIRLRIRKLAQRCGVNGPVNPHAFRHGFAKSFVRNNGDVETLRDLMGHSDTRTTAIYLQWSTEEIIDNYHQHAWD